MCVESDSTEGSTGDVVFTTASLRVNLLIVAYITIRLSWRVLELNTSWPKEPGIWPKEGNIDTAFPRVRSDSGPESAIVILLT